MEQKKIRCAVYTRKSTEEGLDKEFNTLEAQREAGENYIKSQKHMGWTLIPDHYDDGGYSGGSMKRPALKRLLEDVKNDKVDMIVVYNRGKRFAPSRSVKNSLLKGLVECSCCGTMTPTRTRKGNKYYEYYTSSRAVKEGYHLCHTGSVPAGELDRFVLDKVKNAFRAPEIIQELVHQIQQTKPEYGVREVFDVVQSMDKVFQYFTPTTIHSIVRQLIDKVIVYRNKIVIRFNAFGISLLDDCIKVDHNGYAIFTLTRQIRGKSIDEIKAILKNTVQSLKDKDDKILTLEGIKDFYLNNFFKWHVQHILARFTDFVERGSEVPETSFEKYVDTNRKNRYDIEHITPNDYLANKDKYVDEREFESQRNMLGDLILLPADKNRSYQDMPFSEKVEKYFGENLLAKTLNHKCYENNPRFLKFKSDNNLDFKGYDDFDKSTIRERQELYYNLAKMIWSPDNLDRF